MLFFIEHHGRSPAVRRPRGAERGNCAPMLSRRRYARAHIIMREVSSRGEDSACLERWHG